MTMTDILRRYPEWMPIETAPRDGTVFIAWCRDMDWPEAVRWWVYHPSYEDELVYGYWGYAEEVLNDVTGEADPTHWMPLPKVPK